MSTLTLQVILIALFLKQIIIKKKTSQLSLRNLIDLFLKKKYVLESKWIGCVFLSCKIHTFKVNQHSDQFDKIVESLFTNQVIMGSNFDQLSYTKIVQIKLLKRISQYIP